MPRNGSGVASAVPGFNSVAASTTILSALHNSGINDLISMFNTAWPTSLGGTGGTSVITSWDALTAEGSVVPSASTLVLTTATGPRIDISGTTTITAVTLANGTMRIARATGAFKFQAGASLLVNGSSTDSYTTKSGDLLFFQAEAGVVTVYVIGRSLKATYRRRTNRFWNPACEISQQNGTTLGTANGYFACDSLAMYFTAATAAVSVQQIAGPTLNGSAHQIEFKCTTAKASLGASDFVALTNKIEGLNVADLQWGTASAIPATYSFQFKGPQVLNHVHIQNRSGNRHIAIPFTPTAANTEERITVVVPGDTSGTWTVDNDTLLTVDIILAAGATLTGGSASTWSGSTFYAASTQGNVLSVNTNVVRCGDFDFSPDPDATSVATTWMPVDIGKALLDSQRYWAKTYAQTVAAGTTTFIGAVVGTAKNDGTPGGQMQWRFPVTMRTLPSVTIYSPNTGTSGKVVDAANTDANGAAANIGDAGCTITNSAGINGGAIAFYAQATAAIRMT